MSSSKFTKVVEKIIKEYPEMFSALEEYDKTKRLRKISYKERANFTLDANLLRKFRIYCKEKGLNMSKVIEKHIREEIIKNAQNKKI